MRSSDWSLDVCSSDRAERPAAQQAGREADLAAGRAGQELAERDEIGIAALPDPPAADDQFIAEVSEMRDRAAERRKAELQESQEHLARRARRLAARLSCVLVPHGRHRTALRARRQGQWNPEDRKGPRLNSSH